MQYDSAQLVEQIYHGGYCPWPFVKGYRSSTRQHDPEIILLTPKSVNAMLNFGIQHCWVTPSQPSKEMEGKIKSRDERENKGRKQRIKWWELQVSHQQQRHVDLNSHDG